LIIWLNMFHLYIHKDRFPLFCFFEVYMVVSPYSVSLRSI
jgi:hypothetical protein